MINKIIDRIKQEKILLVILAAAVISCIFVPVSDLTVHIDTDTIGILFSMLAISAGLYENGVFDEIVVRTVNKQKDSRSAATVLIMLTFFTAPFITSMGAVSIFVPFTMNVLSAETSVLIYVLAVQTAAANIGCMIFPSASPCSLFLYNRLDMTFSEYAKEILPVYIGGFLLISVLCLFIRRVPTDAKLTRERTMESPYYIFIYLTLMFLDVLAVIGVINMLTVFASVCLVVVIMEPNIFSKVDYTVIVLTVAMYILIGNLGQIKDLTAAFRHVFGGMAPEGEIILSQLIGNLPAAMLFSLCSRSVGMVVSANLGSLGMIYSSYGGVYTSRMFAESFPAEAKKFRRVYFIVGAVLLAALYCFYRFGVSVIFTS
ncbi:MAG: SLC13 family permease [Oscillospiraceae bacterium]